MASATKENRSVASRESSQNEGIILEVSSKVSGRFILINANADNINNTKHSVPRSDKYTLFGQDIFFS
jgi:hypothetical protein